MASRGKNDPYMQVKTIRSCYYWCLVKIHTLSAHLHLKNDWFAIYYFTTNDTIHSMFKKFWPPPNASPQALINKKRNHQSKFWINYFIWLRFLWLYAQLVQCITEVIYRLAMSCHQLQWHESPWWLMGASISKYFSERDSLQQSFTLAIKNISFLESRATQCCQATRNKEIEM